MSDDPTMTSLALQVAGPAAADRGWATQALGLIETDQRRSADTHLLHFDVPALKGLSIYLKDESTHPTGSLKHRLARSLFLYGICNGRIAAIRRSSRPPPARPRCLKPTLPGCSAFRSTR